MVALTNARDIGCCDVVMWCCDVVMLWCDDIWWHLMKTIPKRETWHGTSLNVHFYFLYLLFLFFFFCSVLFCLVLFWVFFYFLLFSILFFFFLRVSSVNPGNRDPLRTGRQSLHGLFQSSNRFFNVVVYNGQVEKRTIRRFQQIWLFYQTLQTSVVLKKQFNFDSVNWSKFFR